LILKLIDVIEKLRLGTNIKAVTIPDDFKAELIEFWVHLEENLFKEEQPLSEKKARMDKILAQLISPIAKSANEG
jgi:hypothetical protein